MNKNSIVAMLVTVLVGVSNGAEPKPFENAVKPPKQDRPWTADLRFSEAELRRVLEEARDGRISGQLQRKIVSDLQALLEKYRGASEDKTASRERTGAAEPMPSESTEEIFYPFREWTSGDFTVEARLVASDQNTATLERKDNGEFVKVDVSKLSYKDRRYVSAVASKGSREDVSKAEPYKAAREQLLPENVEYDRKASVPQRWEILHELVAKLRKENAGKKFYRYFKISYVSLPRKNGRLLVHGRAKEEHGNLGHYPIWVSRDSKYRDFFTKEIKLGDTIKMTGELNYHIQYTSTDKRYGREVEKRTYDYKNNWYVYMDTVSSGRGFKHVTLSMKNPTVEKVHREQVPDEFVQEQ